jgi:hypothetical protein
MCALPKDLQRAEDVIDTSHCTRRSLIFDHRVAKHNVTADVAVIPGSCLWCILGLFKVKLSTPVAGSIVRLNFLIARQLKRDGMYPNESTSCSFE